MIVFSALYFIVFLLSFGLSLLPEAPTLPFELVGSLSTIIQYGFNFVAMVVDFQVFKSSINILLGLVPFFILFRIVLFVLNRRKP